jgi:hypothetical protein
MNIGKVGSDKMPHRVYGYRKWNQPISIYTMKGFHPKPPLLQEPCYRMNLPKYIE